MWPECLSSDSYAHLRLFFRLVFGLHLPAMLLTFGPGFLHLHFRRHYSSPGWASSSSLIPAAEPCGRYLSPPLAAYLMARLYLLCRQRVFSCLHICKISPTYKFDQGQHHRVHPALLFRWGHSTPSHSSGLLISTEDKMRS